MFGIFHYYKKTKSARMTPRGFMMMYTVLFISVVLTISMGILDIALRELAITSVTKESPRALYVADAGLECAFFADLQNGYFGTSTPNTTYTQLCGANDVTIAPVNRATNPIVWQTFMVKFGSGIDLSCAKVIVTKQLDALGNVATTTVDSYGYNTDCPPAAQSRYPLIERGLTAVY